MNMKTSLDGMLLNSIGCDRDWRDYYKHGFQVLIDNLRTLRDEHAKGNHAVVKEFFDIYVIEESEGDDGKA